ncbi:MAG: AMP-binding protein [Dehalococcoidia bacterium]|nr:MAG: AMP-binding protein [Dehalococcoidia bacterium]
MVVVSKGMPDEYFDELEVMSAGARQRYQGRMLEQSISNAYKYCPTAKELLDGVGLIPSKIKKIRDLEKLPVTRKTDLIELQRTKPPYGGMLTIAEEDVERVFLSPGPVYEPIQHSGIKWFAKSFWAAGFRRGDVVVNTFTYHLSPAGILFHEAIRDCGATVIPMGTGHTEVQVRTMADLSVTGFVGTPSFLMAVIKQAEDSGFDFNKDFKVKKAWFTGEMLSPSARKILENKYEFDTRQAYAVTEPGGAIAYECYRKEGMHFMDEYIIEIVDPISDKQLGPGKIGEIVVTPIHNKTWGLIRFGTGDLSSYVTEECPCGRTANRLTGIVGRASDAVKVRGMFVVARQAEGIFSDFPQVSQFQIFVDRKAQRDEMTFRIELVDKETDRGSLADEINRKFQSNCLVKADRIEFVADGTIKKDSKTIVDRRDWR